MTPILSTAVRMCCATSTYNTLEESSSILFNSLTTSSKLNFAVNALNAADSASEVDFGKVAGDAFVVSDGIGMSAVVFDGVGPSGVSVGVLSILGVDDEPAYN